MPPLAAGQKIDCAIASQADPASFDRVLAVSGLTWIKVSMSTRSRLPH